MPNEVRITVTADDKASGTLKDVSREAKGVSESIKGIAASAGMDQLSRGIGAIGSELGSMAMDAAKDAAGVTQLRKAVENSGASYESYARQIDDVIKKGQKLGFTDDQTRESLALLTAQTGSIEEATKRYALAQDLARGANIDVYTASKLLGKANEENVNVLARYGISVKEGATETELFAAVQQRFGGQAKEFGDTVAGAAAAQKIAFDELHESIGASLVPAMGLALEAFQALPGPLQTVTAGILTLGPGIGQAALGIKLLAPMIGSLIPMIAKLGLVLLAPPLGFVVALVAVGIAAYIFRDQIKDAFGAVVGFVVGAVSGIVDAIGGLAASAFDKGKALGDGIYNGLKSGVNLAIDAINSLISAWNGLHFSLGGTDLGPLGKIPTVNIHTPPIPLIPKLATGLDFVPSDNFPALLHRGERVLTAEENRRTGRGGGGDVNLTVRGNVIVNNNGRTQDANKAIADLGYLMAMEARSRGLLLA